MRWYACNQTDITEQDGIKFVVMAELSRAVSNSHQRNEQKNILVSSRNIFSARKMGFGYERMPVCTVEAEWKDEPK